MATQTREPSQFAAGETLSFVRSLADYPASSGWVIHYSIRGGTGSKIDFDSTASGSDHAVTVSSDTTANWIPGRYFGVGVVELDGVRKQIWCGSVVITPNLAAQEGDFDPRTPNRIILDKIDAVLAGKASSDILKSEVQGTTLERMSFKELTDARDYYARKVAAEEAQTSGQSTRKNILIRFT